MGNELKLGFAGELTMSDAMEALQNAMFMDAVPPTWAKRSWPSLRPLASWLTNFNARLNQLDEWQGNPMDIPKVTWLSGLYNPQSFLTAINQVAAQRNQWELDKLLNYTDVTKKMTVDEIDGTSRDGAYINGLSMQGARWDLNAVNIEKSKPKEMFSDMPVMNVRGVSADKADTKGMYLSPVYKTEQRTNFCLPGPAQDQIAGGALDPGRRRAYHGHLVEIPPWPEPRRRDPALRLP